MKIAIQAKPTRRRRARTVTFVTRMVKQSISQLSQQSCCEFVASRRRVDLCRQADFIKRALCLLNTVSPGGTVQNFSRDAHDIYTEFYIGFNSYRDVWEFHRKINDMAPYAIFEKFCSNTSDIDIQVSCLFFFLFGFFLFGFLFLSTFGQRDCYWQNDDATLRLKSSPSRKEQVVIRANSIVLTSTSRIYATRFPVLLLITRFNEGTHRYPFRILPWTE